MPRLFVALRPPSSVREALLGTMSGVPGARWQDDDQLHLTLAFLGKVEERNGEALFDALGAVHSPPFELAVSGVGHFERRGAVSALWAALAPSKPLKLLQQRVVSACRHAGFPPDTKKFTPHVTLARTSYAGTTAGTWLADHGTLHTETWPVERFILYESHLRPEGSLYEPLMQFALRG
ncbi:RNA 2',3'-cyclic phosphodiesterase [Altererythrobacter salegens]|uniref:RNA 2',3'-cyclic phosphodiesterase n=1 Tax=Croceibacterium salegens TaxID=1737568 RepID=A0A6I4STL8_9SPHN|nr:RNA 2',3'-cyclic phosphodiesterase [Croceibacterium salegens]MXO59245.1 RNA 2',3'-cyclic phosphodiesterase [Croceibacterium salegens]